MKKNVFLVLSGILIGCAGMSAERGRAVGQANADVPIPPANRFPPNPSAPKWEQYCGEINNLDAMWGTTGSNHILATRGREGWELVQVVNQDKDPRWLCFKRPAPP